MADIDFTPGFWPCAGFMTLVVVTAPVSIPVIYTLIKLEKKKEKKMKQLAALKDFQKGNPICV